MYRSCRNRRALATIALLAAAVLPLTAKATDDDLLELLVPLIRAVANGGDDPPGDGGDPPGDGGDPGTPCARVESADIFVNTTWRNTDAYCDILVLPRNADDPNASGRTPVSVENATLRIEPGTRVRFADRGSIRLGPGGTLIAAGLSASRIQFEAAIDQPGYGRGIVFSRDSRPSRIEYADFINLGRDESLSIHDAAIAGSRSAGGLTLRHTTVSGSSNHGAEFDELPIIGFERNVFFANAQFGVLVGAHQVHKLDAASDYVGSSAGAANERPYVGVDGVGSFQQVEADASWKSLNAAYYVNIALHLRGGGVDVQPGARFVMSDGARISVDSRSFFRAVGTAARPIVFTGEVATPGWWSNIDYSGSNSQGNELEHVQIRHAGGTRSDAAVEVFAGSYARIANTRINQSARWAVCYDFRSTYVNGPGNDFSGNGSGGVIKDC